MEIDFCCPQCEGTKLFEMKGAGHLVRVFSDGEYSVDGSDSIEPDWLYYCCGECGHIIVEDRPCTAAAVVKDPFDLVNWLFEECLDSVGQAAIEGDQFPIVD
jgi:hypothetical protein